MEKIKVAVVGAGGWGYNHARAYSENPNTYLCSITGRTLERTKARAEAFHVPYYLDVEEMLDKEKPDFVSVCLPALHTYETTMKVIRAGYPLLCEKPLAYDMDQARSMIEEAEKRNLFHAIDFNQRFSKPAKLAKKAMEDGRFGEVNYAMWRFGHGWGSPTMLHPHTNLIEAQCHGFNFLESFCGPIDSIMAEMTDKTGRDGYSTFILALRFKSKAIGTMIATFDASDVYPLAQLIELNGTKGRILIEDNVNKYTFQEKDNPLAETWQAGFFMDNDKAFSRNTDRLIGETVEAFIQGKKPPVPAREGLRALQLAYCAIESFEKGIRVKVPPLE